MVQSPLFEKKKQKYSQKPKFNIKLLTYIILISVSLYFNSSFGQEITSQRQPNSNAKVVKQSSNNGPVAFYVRKGSGPRCHDWGICFMKGHRPRGPKVVDELILADTTSSSDEFEAWATLKGKKLTLTFYYPLEYHKTLPIDKKLAFTDEMNKTFKVEDGYILPSKYKIKYISPSLAVVVVDVVYK